MIIIALGASIPSHAGAPEDTLRAALAAFPPTVGVAEVSPFYRTPAWPDPTDPPFVNAVATVETNLTPADLLNALHGIEARFGRIRTHANAPRTLDLDLIDYNGIVNAGFPVLPHPRAAERAFVLVPLADIAPRWVHPQLRQTAAGLLAALPEADRAAIVPLTAAAG